MKSCKARPAFHISLPSSGLTLNDSRSAASTPGTPLPHTPLPFDMNDFHSSMIGIKRSRDEDEISISSVSSWEGGVASEIPDDKWQRAELDVLDSILHNPLRPLSTASAYPPSTLPPPQALDELTNQILSIAMNASPNRTRGTTSQEWPHSWSETRSRLFQIALKESKGLTLAEGRVEWVRSRPSIKRVGSMDFLEDAEGTREEERSRDRCEPLSFGEPLVPLHDATPIKTPSVTNIPSMTLTPSSPVAPSPSPSRRRPSRPSYTRRPSLLQRGRSFTASDLASEDGHCDDDVDDIVAPTTPPAVEDPMTPTKRLTRSQSSMFPSHSTLSPKGLTKAFLAPKEPSTGDKAELCKPFELAPLPPSSAAGEEGTKRRKLERLGSGFQITPVTPKPFPQPGFTTDGLSSPFEERGALNF